MPVHEPSASSPRLVGDEPTGSPRMMDVSRSVPMVTIPISYLNSVLVKNPSHDVGTQTDDELASPAPVLKVDVPKDDEFIKPHPLKEKNMNTPGKKVDNEEGRQTRKRTKSPRVKHEHKEDMVPIGMGTTTVSRSLLKQIDWGSHTIATRKLMDALFPSSVLATHSLSGRASPAFPEKPAKTQLDPMIIQDIILEVLERCDEVTDTMIKSSITSKCADEAKKLRNELNQKK